MTAARDEPIAGGRHKVFGNHALAVIPQTSTIASHLPRAVGVAFAIERAKKLGVESAWPADAVVVCSFGDASVNHAAAQAALNSAAHLAHQGLPLPLLFVCEDNRLGISVRSPAGWVESALRARPALRYEAAPGDDPEVALETAEDLVARIREERRPGVLHLSTVRFLSHAGADVETAYRTPQEIRADWDADPLLATGRWLAAAGARTGEELAEDYLAERERVLGAARDAARLPQLESAADVMRPLAPRTARSAGTAAGGDEAVTLAQSDQPRARGRARARSPRAPLRRGRRGQGWRLRGHARPAAPLRRGPGLRHAPRRDLDPRPRAGHGRERLPADARDPVPRLSAQRRGPAPRRGGDAAVLLAGGTTGTAW